MSASLLAELSAIETIMTEKAKETCPTPKKADLVQRTSEQEEEMRAEAMTSPAAAEMEEDHEIESDHMCAICLVNSTHPVSRILPAWITWSFESFMSIYLALRPFVHCFETHHMDTRSFSLLIPRPIFHPTFLPLQAAVCSLACVC